MGSDPRQKRTRVSIVPTYVHLVGIYVTGLYMLISSLRKWFVTQSFFYDPTSSTRTVCTLGVHNSRSLTGKVPPFTLSHIKEMYPLWLTLFQLFRVFFRWQGLYNNRDYDRVLSTRYGYTSVNHTPYYTRRVLLLSFYSLSFPYYF